MILPQTIQNEAIQVVEHYKTSPHYQGFVHVIELADIISANPSQFPVLSAMVTASRLNFITRTLNRDNRYRLIRQSTRYGSLFRDVGYRKSR